jgi:hypothetical protein
MTIHKNQPVDASVLQTSKSRMLLDAWLNWRGCRLMPRWGDIERSDLSEAADNFYVLECRGREQLVFVEAGERIREVLGRDVVGCNFFDFTGREARRYRIERLARQLAQPCAAVATVVLPLVTGFLVPVESVGLPVMANDSDATAYLVGTATAIMDNVIFDTGSREGLTHFASDYVCMDIGAGVPAPVDLPA